MITCRLILIVAVLHLSACTLLPYDSPTNLAHSTAPIGSAEWYRQTDRMLKRNPAEARRYLNACLRSATGKQKYYIYRMAIGSSIEGLTDRAIVDSTSTQSVGIIPNITINKPEVGEIAKQYLDKFPKMPD